MKLRVFSKLGYDRDDHEIEITLTYSFLLQCLRHEYSDPSFAKYSRRIDLVEINPLVDLALPSSVIYRCTHLRRKAVEKYLLENSVDNLFFRRKISKEERGDGVSSPSIYSSTVKTISCGGAHQRGSIKGNASLTYLTTWDICRSSCKVNCRCCRKTPLQPPQSHPHLRSRKYARRSS